jgi:KaiC/GvpD/RAD55 family RecA-like ATPase
METLFPPKDRRTQLFRFFDWLRSLDQTTLIISDSVPRDPANGAAEEEVLADGIFRLSTIAITRTEYQRRIQCLKMRCVKHIEDERTLLFEDGRFEVARPIG